MSSSSLQNQGHVQKPVPWDSIVRVFLGVLLLWASISKLSNPTQFLGSIYAYELPLPTLVLKLAGVALPWLELLCGLSLLGKVWIETSLSLTGIMFAGFVIATGQAWARGLKISCGCFDFSMLGLDKDNSKVVKFLESPGFAFFRNLVLSYLVYVLLRKTFINPSPSLSPAKSLNSGPISKPKRNSKK